MDSHATHVHGDDHEHHAPFQTFCHDVSHALGVAMGQYLRSSQITHGGDIDVHDHGRDEYATSDHVDDHEDVHEVPHDHQDDHMGSCSRLPL